MTAKGASASEKGIRADNTGYAWRLTNSNRVAANGPPATGLNHAKWCCVKKSITRISAKDPKPGLNDIKRFALRHLSWSDPDLFVF